MIKIRKGGSDMLETVQLVLLVVIAVIGISIVIIFLKSKRDLMRRFGKKG